ncbi:hypothetical protein B0A49_12595, partial [Cryomyces minteri]
MGHQINKYNVAHTFQKRRLLIAINCLAGLSIFFFGYDQGMMGGVNNAKAYIDLMGFGHTETAPDGTPNTPVITNTLLQGGIVSVYYLGTLVGALLGGWIGDRVGRIKTIALGSAWAIPWSHPPVLRSELQLDDMRTHGQRHRRGQFIAIEFTLNIFGVVVAYWLEFGLSYVNGGVSQIRWRFPIGFQIIPLLLLLAIVWYFPESPRWLVKVGRHEEAR